MQQIPKAQALAFILPIIEQRTLAFDDSLGVKSALQRLLQVCRGFETQDLDAPILLRPWGGPAFTHSVMLVTPSYIAFARDLED